MVGVCVEVNVAQAAPGTPGLRQAAPEIVVHPPHRFMASGRIQVLLPHWQQTFGVGVDELVGVTVGVRVTVGVLVTVGVGVAVAV